MRYVLALCLLLLLSPEVSAEVSDKAASHLQLWLQGFIVGGVALLTGLFRPLLGLVIGLPIALLFGYASYGTLADPYIGPALLAEQGYSYRIAMYGAPTLCALGACTGALLGLRSRTVLGERRTAS